MSIELKLASLAETAKRVRHTLESEEATKTALILPFLMALDYNVFDPTEVVPEFRADVGVKPQERVDYALIRDGQPIILIEAKQANVPLSDRQHLSQLFRYWNATPVKIGILTNGIEYRFHTDLENINVMDSQPFLDLDIINLSPGDKEILVCFSKDNYDLKKAIRLSEQKSEQKKEALKDFSIVDNATDPIREGEIAVGDNWKTLKDCYLERQNRALKKETPTIARFPGGKDRAVSSWKTFAIEVAEWLIQTCLLNQTNCTVPATKRGYLIVNTVPQHENGKPFVNPHKLSNGLYMPVQGSARTGTPSQMLRVSYGLIKHCGQDPSQVWLKTG